MTRAATLGAFLMAGASLLSSCASQKNAPRTSFTLLYGAEYPEDTAYAAQDIRADMEILDDNRKYVDGAIIGDGKSMIHTDDIEARFRALQKSGTDNHTYIVNFHASAEITKAPPVVFYEENSLKNHAQYDDEDFSLNSAELFRAMSRGMTAAGKQDVWMGVYTPCHGLSSPRFGDLPPGHLLIGSSATESTFDYHTALMQASQEKKPWNLNAAEHFIPCAILLQNATTGYDNPDDWQRGGFVAVIRNKKEKQNTLDLGGQTLEFGRHEVRILDLVEKSVTLLRDFPRAELDNLAQPLHAMTPMLLQAAYDKRHSSRTKKRTPLPEVLEKHRFDENLFDTALDRLGAVNNRHDFWNKLTDPEQRALMALAYPAHTRAPQIENLPRLPEFWLQHNVWPFDPNKRKPRYENVTYRSPE